MALFEETQGSRPARGSEESAERGSLSWQRWVKAAFGRVSHREWLFFGLLILCYVFILEPAGTNTISRYDMVWALAHGTASIDPFAKNTIDLSYFHGHYYSPRSLGLSLLAVPVFWVLQQIMHNPPVIVPTMNIAIPLMNMFTVVPIAIIASIVFYRFVLRLRPSLAGTPIPLVVTTAFALGTLEYPFAVSFFSHAMGGGLMLVGFYLLYCARTSPHPERLVLLAGLLVGYAVITEYPTGIIMLALCAYVVAIFPGRRLRMLIWFGLGMVPSIILLGWYDWFAFGNPFHISYDSVTGQQSQGQHVGFFGITLPQPAGLLEILAWPRGLLVESPFLLFVVIGFIRWWRESSRPSAEMLVCLGVSIVYPLAIASYYLPMAGQNLPGPRLLVPMLPFACLALAWAVDEKNVVLRSIFALLLALGILLSYLYVVIGVYEYHTLLTYPIANLFVPLLQTGTLPLRLTHNPVANNLASFYFNLANQISLYVILVPLATWTIYLGVSLIRWHPGAKSAQ